MNPRRPLMREIAIVLGTSVFLAFTYNVFSTKGIPLFRRETENVAVADSDLFPSVALPHGTRPGPPAPPAAGQAGETTGAKVVAPEHERALRNPDSMAAEVAKERKEQSGKDIFRIITLSQFKRLIAGAKPVIIDARDADAYRKGHVKGALNVYGLEADQHFTDLVQIPRDTLVVLYCNNAECHLGRMAADFLAAIGFTNLYLYDDGWDGWEKARMPVDTLPAAWQGGAPIR